MTETLPRHPAHSERPPTNAPDPEVKKISSISRRDVLKFSGLALSFLAGSYTGRKLFPYLETEQENESLVTPEIVHGVKVYGLKTPIETEEQLDKLYSHFDQTFSQQLPQSLQTESGAEKREWFFGRNRRSFELVVTESTYLSFAARRKETGVDFPEWIKMHVEMMHRTFKNAKPPANLRIEFLRIVVVGNNFRDNPSRYSLDLDGSWFINSDYRGHPLGETKIGWWWSFYHDNEGNLIFREPAGGEEISEKYQYPPDADSLTGRNGIWLDCGLPHEWSHAIFNLPDEYLFDVGDAPFRFRRFLMSVSGAYHEPWLSPYLSYLLKRNEEKGVRGYYTSSEEPEACFGERPKEITLDFRGGSNVKIHRVGLESDYYSKKTFSGIPDQESETGQITMNQALFNPQEAKGQTTQPLCHLIRVQTENGMREIFMPMAAFNMSKINGLDRATYKIEFGLIDNPDKKTQILHQVDESDLENYFKNQKEKSDPPYALMKVEGTSTYFIWLLQD